MNAPTRIPSAASVDLLTVLRLAWVGFLDSEAARRADLVAVPRHRVAELADYARGFLDTLVELAEARVRNREGGAA